MSDVAPLMAGKRGLIMGVANDRSIAWGIASAIARPGRRSSPSTYQGDALAKRVQARSPSGSARSIVLPNAT